MNPTVTVGNNLTQLFQKRKKRKEKPKIFLNLTFIPKHLKKIL